VSLFFGPPKEVKDFRFALDAFMRMVAGAYLIGGVRNVARTLNGSSEILEVNISETPRGPEIHFTFREPFSVFSGFVEMPEKVDFVDFGVHLQGHEKYSGFGASLNDAQGQIAVDAIGSTLNRPTKSAQQLAKAFVAHGAIDVGNQKL